MCARCGHRVAAGGGASTNNLGPPPPIICTTSFSRVSYLYKYYWHVIALLYLMFCSNLIREASSAVVNRAKQNVIRYYSTVGILEDLDTFIRLLERMFPTYFTGLHAAHNTKGNKISDRKNYYKRYPGFLKIYVTCVNEGRVTTLSNRIIFTFM